MAKPDKAADRAVAFKQRQRRGPWHWRYLLAWPLMLSPACFASPALDVLLKPIVPAGGEGRIEGLLRLSASPMQPGDVLLHMATVADSIPTTSYDSVSASDSTGPLPLSHRDSVPTSHGTFRDWIVTRATIGDTLVRFTAYPRPVSPATRPGPFQDLRSEAGGFDGAALGFLPLPPAGRNFATRVHWDLTQVPKDWIAVSSFGSGDFAFVGATDRLNEGFYMAGPVNRYPNPPQGRFALYWLSRPPFDPVALADFTGRLYATESQFFGDTSTQFTVFLRRQPYLSGGGQSFEHSFALGYSGVVPQSLTYVHWVLSHEMVHNWMDLQAPDKSTDRAATGWYSEGGAEYYSTLLSYRAGLLTPDQLIARLNAKLLTYYANGLNRLTNQEADARSWTDRRAGKIPYARGFVFLAATDARIRAATSGRHGLDEVVRELRHRQVSGRPYGVAQWRELVSRYLGRDAGHALDRMASGALLAIPANSFAPCLKLEPRRYREFDVGFDQRSLDGGQVIGAVDPSSNAARAGLKAGDKIVRFTDPSTLMEDDAARLDLVLERNGAEQTISYLPRGKYMPGFIWIKNKNIDFKSCKI